ncbi:CYTH and CHAD domain-containing protein [Aquincola sp. S2]|uniref:CYTH and CHAD domain-containing protein n=1 Tax=Pseudaquabacterium terrae TaxID=2732868 RepID=A0ABX2EJX1_9BURK|nr:CYTH and CHAD domain-containing protein [Aquabacterium terrae]NRF68915.1 CYTH and CHAD domain-containing protein [Aquabacterium terrae]
MVEIELKFQVPPERQAALQRAVATASAETLRLQALYFDTADRRLAGAGIALRLRREGPVWVQTLKALGAHALERLEHEVVVGRMRAPPALDLQRHAGTPAAARLDAALGSDVELVPVYQTDVRRTRRVLRTDGARIEIALDVGEIRAGERQQPLHEIEFELLAGPLDGLISVAARWAERHALWLDVRPKSERGDLLARGLAVSPAAGAGVPVLTNKMSGDAALRAIVGAALAQALPNAAALAAGCGTPEHLHQLRIGLRRLRAALRTFGAENPALDPAWQPALAALFAQLGGTRDRDVMRATLQPLLEAAGAPLVALPEGSAAADDTVCEALRASATTQLLLALLGFAHGASAAAAPSPTPPTPPPVLPQLIDPLRRLQRRIRRDARDFRSAPDEQRHRLRKRLKRLRYGLDALAALLPAKPLRRYLSTLKPAQEALGELNDLVVAEAAFRALVADDARAWFALGWLAARRGVLLEQAAQALDALPGWPKAFKQRR